MYNTEERVISSDILPSRDHANTTLQHLSCRAMLQLFPPWDWRNQHQGLKCSQNYKSKTRKRQLAQLKNKVSWTCLFTAGALDIASNGDTWKHMKFLDVCASSLAVWTIDVTFYLLPFTGIPPGWASSDITLHSTAPRHKSPPRHPRDFHPFELLPIPFWWSSISC